MITGHCECGRVQYQVDGPIHDFSHCHCSQCRRSHGAAFASFAGVARSAFKIVSGEEEIASYASAPGNLRKFCKTCGSNIGAELGEEPDDFFIAMGTMNGVLELPPGYHIFVGSRATWHDILDDLPQYDTLPEVK